MCIRDSLPYAQAVNTESQGHHTGPRRERVNDRGQLPDPVLPGSRLGRLPETSFDESPPAGLKRALSKSDRRATSVRIRSHQMQRVTIQFQTKPRSIGQGNVPSFG